MLGQMTDTNSAWLSAYLSEKGLGVARHFSVGDDLATLEELLAECFRRHEVTLVTGGLGPTEDDLTRLAAARALGRPLEYKGDLALGIESFMTERGYQCSSNNLRQAWLPAGSSLVPNPWGTAPAFSLEGPGHLMVFMPGVPQEMKSIVGSYLGPKLEEKFPARLGHGRTTVLRAAGLGESRVDELLGDLLRGSRNPVLGLLAGPYETRILVTTRAGDSAEAERLEAPVIAEAIRRLGPNYVGRDGLTMVGSVCSLLEARSLRLGLADSVTGGLAAEPFIRILAPGNLSGSLAVPRGALQQGIEFLFREMGADLVGTLDLSGDQDGAGQDPEGEPMVLSRILERPPQGGQPVEISASRRLLGRPRDMAMARAGALLAFQLWEFLKGPGR
jgi:nicotinamide-nucleotide amidase